MNDLSPIQVSLFDVFGGADRVALTLHQQYLKQGLDAKFLVSNKRCDLPEVYLLPHDSYRSRWAQTIKGGSSARSLAGAPIRTMRNWLGYADYDYPASSLVEEFADEARRPVLHFHTPTVHFDVRLLPHLSTRFPTILTLHDALTFTGWCLHSFDCDRWKTGCGDCPQLAGPPRVASPTPRDRTHANWKMRRDIYARSRLWIAAPSRWMAERVGSSILRSSAEDIQVIPNGIDTSLFAPLEGEREGLRTELALLPSCFVVTMTAIGKAHPFKDSATSIEAVKRCAATHPDVEMVLVLIGDMDAPETPLPNLSIVSTGYLTEQQDVVRYLQASDVQLHSSFADTFPLAILEAQSCGLPVIASELGGIPETIEDAVTGFLVPPQDPQATAARLSQLLDDRELRWGMGNNARSRAVELFDEKVMALRYLEYYEQAARAHEAAN